MHKRLVNHCTINLSLIPDGPILIKSGKEGADPTKPDMEFVETYHGGSKTIYLPGSSLKGAIRAHAEKIVRTVGSDERPKDGKWKLWTSNPLDSNDKQNNPNATGSYLEDWKKKHKDSANFGSEIYKQSCFISQLFGNTSLASRLRIEDAYPDPAKPIKTEERNGVAIDRVFGSVAVGPFNYQVCTAGEFQTEIHLKNFSLAQLGLIGLVLRDLNDGWFGIGFAKSRGLGTVKVKLNSAVVQYPSCELRDGKIYSFGQDIELGSHNILLGAGEFLPKAEAEKYGFLKEDRQDIDDVAATSMDFGFGVQLAWQGNEKSGVPNLFKCAVGAWKKSLERAA